jgi:hypothetical protein
MIVHRSVAAALLLGGGVVAGCGGESGRTPTGPAPLTVGVHGRVRQVVIAGAECEPIPLTDRRQAIVVRITGLFPHGTDFRYDLEYYGLEPGRYDLVQYLRRTDGTPLQGAAPIEVEIVENLPPGQPRPAPLDESSLPVVGGYTRWLWIGGMLWGFGLLALLFLHRAKTEQAGPAVQRPLTLADRLRPLTEQARAGTLDSTGKAELERLVLGYWGGRIGIASIGSVEALQQLKAHPDAGELLRQMETWLHAPPGRGDSVDLHALLAPYASIPADA